MRKFCERSIVAVPVAIALLLPIIIICPSCHGFLLDSNSDHQTEMVAIDKLITQAFMPINQIPGFGLSILKITVTPNGSRQENMNNTMTRGYGFSNLEHKVLTTPSTLFPVGSISKGFVGILVVKILSEKFPELGEHMLDVPIRQLIPAANYTLIDRIRSTTVSFRDLMAHRLCTRPDVLGFKTHAYKSSQDYIQHQRCAPEVCPLRSSFEYNDGGVADASELIALLAGTTLENLLKQLFLVLGMKDTTFVQENVDYDNKVNMARGYYRNGTRILKYNPDLLKRVSYAIGAGGVVTTAQDMLKYIAFHLNNGKVGDAQIFSEEAMGWLRKSVISVSDHTWITGEEGSVAIGDFGYGIGLGIGTYNGYERISHVGYIQPYSSFFSYYPAFGIGIFTAANGPGNFKPGSDMPILHGRILDILRNGPTATPSIPFKPVVQVHKKIGFKSRRPFELSALVKVEELSTAQITGNYSNPQSGEFSLLADSTSAAADLYIRYGRWGTGYLRKIENTSPNHYRAEWDSDLVQDDFTEVENDNPDPYIFDFSEFGKVSVDIGNGEAPVVFFKIKQTLDKSPNHSVIELCGEHVSEF